MHIATAYHAGLRFPADVATWARRTPDGYAHVALKVAALLRQHPMIAAPWPDGFQPSSAMNIRIVRGDQHALGMACSIKAPDCESSPIHVQRIYKEDAAPWRSPACDWVALTAQAHAFEELDTPHRWKSGCPELGQWTLRPAPR